MLRSEFAEHNELQFDLATVVAQLDNPGLARLNGVARHQDDFPNLQPFAFRHEQAGAEPAGVADVV